MDEHTVCLFEQMEIGQIAIWFQGEGNVFLQRLTVRSSKFQASSVGTDTIT